MSFDATGFTPDTLQDILDSMTADAIATNPNLDPSSNALMGILLGLIANQGNIQNQHIAELVSSIDRDTAEKKALDVLAWNQGLIRQDGESDEALRSRISRFLSAGGNATVRAIYAQVSNVKGVSDVNIAENECSVPVLRRPADLDATDTYRPANCFEVCVEGGSDYSIARAIRLTKPTGIQAFGKVVFPSIDTQGIARTIGFTRREEVNVYLRLTYNVYNEEVFPVTGENSIADALIVFAAKEYIMGKDIIYQRIVGEVHDAVSGVQNVSVETSLDGITYLLNSRPMAAHEKAIILKENITFISK